MDGLGIHTALAIRLHESGGTPRSDAQASATLLECVGLVAGARLVAPPEEGNDGAVVLRPDGPESLLELIERTADGLRPARATYGVALAGANAPVASLDRVVVGADAVTTAALTALLATGLRSTRVAILAPARQPLLEALTSLILEFTDRMTDRQRQVIALVRDSRTQQQVAKHLGVSRQAVNQSLTSAGWHHIRHAETAVRDGLVALALGRGQRV